MLIIPNLVDRGKSNMIRHNFVKMKNHGEMHLVENSKLINESVGSLNN